PSRNNRIEIKGVVGLSFAGRALRESILRPNDPKIVFTQPGPKADIPDLAVFPRKWPPRRVWWVQIVVILGSNLSTR
ncbi:MAG: hypothetical protein V3U28_06735, partial [Candidatus Acidoferrales bacterium]